MTLTLNLSSGLIARRQGLKTRSMQHYFLRSIFQLKN